MINDRSGICALIGKDTEDATFFVHVDASLIFGESVGFHPMISIAEQ
jgi:hypothetical protein